MSFMKEDWKALNSKGKWDILVALRGPDSRDSGTLKWFTTAVIRAKSWKLFKPEGGSAVVNYKLPCVIMPEGYHLPLTISGKLISRFDFNHFFQHVDEAAHLMSIPVHYIDPDVYLAACLTGSQIAAMSIIYESPATSKVVKNVLAPILGKAVDNG